MEFYSQGNGESLDFVGYSYFVTDANGAYEGNLLLADEEIERELAKYIPTSTLHAVCDMLRHSIGEVINSNYCGYVGVDMMICQIVSESGEKVYRLHPCVEINLRMNMGVVAHTLRERYVAKGCTGKFMVEYYPTPIALKEAHEQKMNLYPLETDSDGCITRGYLPLTPIGRETQYIGWIMIE